jgi:hypothetical protein
MNLEALAHSQRSVDCISQTHNPNIEPESLQHNIFIYIASGEHLVAHASMALKPTVIHT